LKKGEISTNHIIDVCEIISKVSPECNTQLKATL